MVKISLDLDSCCGTGYCERVAPEIFKVVDDKVTFRADPTATSMEDESSVEPDRIRRAAAACPWRVIQVSE